MQGNQVRKRIIGNDRDGWAVGQSVGLVQGLDPALAQAPEMTPHPPLPARARPATPTPRGGTPPALTHIPVCPTPFSLFGTRPGPDRQNREPGTARDGVGGCTHA
jgi:hypothetical protein